MKYAHTAKASLNGFGDSTPNLPLSDPTFAPTQDPSCRSKNDINLIPGAAPGSESQIENEGYKFELFQLNDLHTTQSVASVHLYNHGRKAFITSINISCSTLVI